MRRYFLFLFLFATTIACQKKLIPAASAIRETPIRETVLIPSNPAIEVYHDLRYAEEVMKFYERRHYKPYWLDQNISSARADSLTIVIRSVRQYGLLPQHYHAHEILDLTSSLNDDLKIARLDVILTDAFLSIAHDLKRGCIQRSYAPTVDSAQVALLTDSLIADDVASVLKTQEPRYAEYALLRHALNMILDSVNVRDQNLLMQGITIDSIEIHRKVQRIEINMERWRTENASLENVYTWINIPAFMFYVVENHKVVMESAVVVGAPSTPTPLFSSNIECFTIFPYWYMPRKIAVQEYLPVIKRDTSFLSRNNFDVLDRNGKIQNPKTIDWKKYNENNFPFTLRQREGKENSLGIIKFVFDNPYAVYLHDTNSKKLFKHRTRAYSHGCIRLEKAVEFAHYLIGGDRTRISSRTLNKYLDEQKRLTISLFQPMPIHIRYFTCEVRNGELLFHPDIYKKDNMLISTLYGKNTF